MKWISDVLAWVDAHQVILIPIAVLLLTDISNGLVKYPGQGASIARVIIGFILDRLSIHTNANSPGTFKIPLIQGSKPPTAQLASAPIPRGFVDLKLMLSFLSFTVILVLVMLPGCAGVAWNTPVFTAGPTVSPIEEITLKTAKTATTAGFSECVGLGQFEAVEHNWDALDLCAVEVGGIVNASGTPGVLQVGPEIGTFNNILGVGLLFTPYTADGQGFFQGGGPGFAVAGMFNIAAITAWLGTGTSSSEGGKEKLTPRLPRGGL